MVADRREQAREEGGEGEHGRSPQGSGVWSGRPEYDAPRSAAAAVTYWCDVRRRLGVAMLRVFDGFDRLATAAGRRRAIGGARRGDDTDPARDAHSAARVAFIFPAFETVA